VALRPEDLNVGTTPTNKELRKMVEGQPPPPDDYGPPPAPPPSQRELANAKLRILRAAAQEIPDEPQEAPQPARKSAKEAMAELAAQEEEDNRRAQRNAIWAATDAAKKLSPSEAAEIQKYGAIVDSSYPIEEIQKGLPEIRRAAAEANFDWAEKASRSPVLAKYIGNPLTASQIAADSASMTGIEAALTGKFEVMPITLKNPETGEEFHDVQIKWTPPAPLERLRDVLVHLPTQLEIGNRQMLAAAHLIDISPEQRVKDRNTLITVGQQLNKDYAGDNKGALARGIINAEMMVAEALPVMAVGAAGAATGGVPGAIAMTTAYLAPLKFPDHAEYMKGHDEAALATTLIGSAAEAALFTKGFGGQMGLYKKGMESLFPELMGKSLERISLSGLAGKGMQTWTHEMISGAFTMTTAGVMDKAMKNIGRLYSTGQPVDPNMLDGVVEDFFHNLQGMPILAAWGTHAKMMADVGQMSKSYANKKWVDAWADGVLGSKILSSNKRLFEQLTREMGVQPGSATHLYLDREAFEEHALKNGFDPSKVIKDIIGGDKDYWAEVLTDGSKDIAIPIQRAHRLVMAKEWLQFVRDEGRFHETAVAPRVLKEMADLFHKDIENPPGPKTPAEEAIHEDVRLRVREALEKSNKEMPHEGEGAYTPDEAAKHYADVLLAMTNHIHSRLPGSSLTQIHEMLWGQIGFWHGGEEQVSGLGQLKFWKRDIDRRIMLTPDGKLAPVSIKDLQQGYIRSIAGGKVAPADVESGSYPTSRLVADPDVSAKSNPNVGAWYDIGKKEIILFDTQGWIKGHGATNLIHETGHAFMWMLRLLAKEHPTEFKAEYDSLSRALGYKDGADRLTNYKSANEERISIWFEEFFRRGKAPTPELVDAFNTFGFWIRQFYSEPGTNKRRHTPEDYWAQYATELSAKSGENRVYTAKEFGDLPLTLLHKFLGAEEALAEFRAKLDLVDKRVIEQLRKEGKLDEQGNPVFDKEGSVGGAAQTAREQLLAAIDRSERSFAKKAKEKFKEQFLKDLKDEAYSADDEEVQYQRIRAWLTEGETWGTWDPELVKSLTDPETGKPLKLLYSEMERLLGKESAQRMARAGMTTRKETGSIAASDLQQMLTQNGLGYWGEVVDPDHPLQLRPWLMEISSTRTLEQYLNAKASDAVFKQYGYELLDNPAALHKAALDAAMNEKELAKRIVLLRSITQGLSPDRLQRAQLTEVQWKQLAANMMQDKTLRQIQPERYYRSMIAADQRALKALEEGSSNRAFDAIQQAIINHYLYKEAKLIDTSMEAAYERMGEKVASDKWRSELGKADPAYRDVTDALLVAMGFSDPQSAPWAAKDPQTFMDALLAKIMENGQDSRMVGWDPKTVIDLITSQKAWHELTPAEAKEIYNAVLNIKKLADEVNDIRIADQKADIRDLQEEMEVALHLAGREQVFEPKDTSIVSGKMDGFMKGVLGFRTNLMEPRTWLRYFGKEVYDRFIDSFVKQRDYKVHLLQDVMGEFQKSFEDYKGKDTMFGVTPGISDALPIEGQKGEVSKRWLMQVMLWMGSESSRAKLLKYTHWTPEQVFEAAGQFLTKEDLKWVQAQHDISERKLKPLIAVEHERRYGLPFEEVRAMPYQVTLADGTVVDMGGGYYPVRYDRKRSRMSFIKSVEDIDSGGLNDLYPKVSDHYMEARTGYVDKPDLNWNGYPSHIQRVVHDLAFGDWVHNTAKFFLNKRTNAIIRERLGDAIADQPKEWLQAVAFDGNLHPNFGTDGVQRAIQMGRGTLAAASLGWNAAIFGAHIFHPFAAGAIQNRGFGFNITNTVPAYTKTMASWAAGLGPGGENAHYEWAKQTFSEVAHRADTTVEEFRNFASMMGSPPSGRAGRILQSINATNMFFIKHGDAMVSTVIATARYEGEMARGATHEEAVKAANRAVAEAMPTHNPMEMPSLTRNKNGMGAAIIFYGYWSKLFQMAETRRAEDVMAGQGGDMMKIAELAGSTMAMLIYAETMGAYFMGHGKDQDEDWGTWAARRTAGAPFRMLPLASNYAQPWIDYAAKSRQKKPMTSPIGLPYLAPFDNIVRNVTKVVDRKSTTDEKVVNALEVVLTGQAFFTKTPIPVRAPMRAAHYGYGLLTGQEKPRGPGDVVSGFAFGHSRKHQAETPFTSVDTVTQGGHP
jgi:hypothetical protein